MSGAERIKINPAKIDIPSDGAYLDVEGPDAEKKVRVTYVRTDHRFTPDYEDQIYMHTRDWCAFFDWWACNIWGMEGDDDGESTAEADQPSPPETQG